MIRRCAIALVLLSLAAPVFAQDVTDVSQYDPGRWFQPACPKCGMKAAIDWVQALTIDGTRLPVIAGWGFECQSGRAADRVEAFAWDPARGVFVPVTTELRWPNIRREDVFNAKVSECSNAPADSGFGAAITGTLPEGSTMLQINVWRGPYHQTTSIPVLTR